MIGAIRMVCATIIACGVNSRPHDPSGPDAREQEIDREPDHDRRQAHQRIEDHDHGLAAGKAGERDGGAERHADEGAEGDRRQADDQRQPHDRQQRRIGREHQLKR